MITLPTGSPGARILGMGDYRPSRIVTNDELALRVETSDQWVRDRTGIVTRRIAAPGETVVDLSTEAAAKAIAASGVPAAEIDLAIVATCSAEDRLPGVAPVVANRLGLDAPGAYDLNAACAGFCYALSAASDAIRAGNARHALVVGVEKLSNIIDWDDRSTCIIFADGAGAAVVGPSERPGIGPVVWGSDGSRGRDIRCLGEDPFLRMEGQAVFRWATTQLAPIARRACAVAGLEPRDLDAVVLHQANVRIIDAIVRALDVRDKVVSHDVVDVGNTSAASVPLALTRLIESGEVATGDTALLLGFGSGLSFAGQVIHVP